MNVFHVVYKTLPAQAQVPTAAVNGMLHAIQTSYNAQNPNITYCGERDEASANVNVLAGDITMLTTVYLGWPMVDQNGNHL